MIDPAELRIGNIVMIDNLKHHPDVASKYLKILSIRTRDIQYDVELYDGYTTYNQFLKFISPVEISPDVLARLGFTLTSDDEHKTKYIYDEHLSGFHHKPIYVEYDKSVKAYLILIFGINQSVTYVHELQNIIYTIWKIKITLIM